MIDILVINYLEKSFAQTLQCVKGLDGNVIMQDRSPRGVGSLAQAVNQGFKQVKTSHFLVVTNCTFNPDSINRFVKESIEDLNPLVAIQPTYVSDHKFLRKPTLINDEGWRSWQHVPFTEFTFVLLESEAFDNLGGVDESMPYVGFDIDYGLRANKIGIVAVHQDYEVQHTYNRHLRMNEACTRERARMRRRAEVSTLKRLRELYGANIKEQLTTNNWHELIK